MKKTSIILSVAALAGAAAMTISCSNAPQATTTEASDAVSLKGAIVYFNLDTVSQEYDMANDLRSVVETKVQSQKLQQQQNDFQNYAAQKQQEIAEEQAVMMNQIADAIKTFVDKYTEEQGFALVLTTQGDVLPAPVVTGNEELDITQAVIDGLNAEYVKEKAKTEKK